MARWSLRGLQQLTAPSDGGPRSHGGSPAGSTRTRVVFDNLSLLWHYAVGQGLFGLLLVHGFPRIA
jgi:hypothetical protein